MNGPLSSSTKTLVISIVLIIILGFSAYINSLNNGFVWDDDLLVKENFYIRDLSKIKDFFAGKISTDANEFRFYRPLYMISYLVDYRLWRLSAKNYHLTNILIHICAALALFWMISSLYGNRLLSFLVTIFFIAHPIHTEVVAYISGRSDSLAGFFMLLAIVFYIKALDREKAYCFLLVILSYIGSLLSREAGLIFPALLLSYHYAFRKKIKPVFFFTILGVTLCYILLRIAVLKDLFANSVYNTTFLERLPGFFVAIFNYIKHLMLPLDLHMEYGRKLFSVTDPRAIIGLLMSVFILIYAFKKRRTNPLVFFSISWFFISLIPVSNLYPINAYMAEHWLYIPSIGFFLILGDSLRYLYIKKETRTFAILAVIALLAFYFCLTVRENKSWRSPVIYEKTLRYSQDWRTYNNLANAYSRMGEKKLAVKFHGKALEINPWEPKLYYDMGVVYLTAGREKEAIELFKKALEIKPDYAAVYNNLGILSSYIGKHKEAIELFEKALQIDPDYADVYNNLGLLYSNIGESVKAIELFKKALEIKPGYAELYYNLGNTYADLKKYEDAIASYKKALEINPNYIAVYNNISSVYYDIGEYGLAIEYCDKAAERGFNVRSELLDILKPYRKYVK